MFGLSSDGFSYFLDDAPNIFPTEPIAPGYNPPYLQGLLGFKGTDTLIGSAAPDTIYGGKDNDLIFGKAGNDLLLGDRGNDRLFGGSDSDKLMGFDGDDILVGGIGEDTMIGGADNDVFVLPIDGAVTDIAMADVIADFNSTSDLIGLTNGLTEADIILEGIAEKTLIKQRLTGTILGQVIGVSAEQLMGRFVAQDGTLNNNFNVERDLGKLTDTQSLTGFVGNTEPLDLYNFSVDSSSNYLQINLDGLSANADLVLFQDRNSNSLIDGDEIIAFSQAEGTDKERIDILLNTGTYFLIVGQFEGETNYNLNLSAIPIGEFSTDAQVSIAGVSETSFNPVDSTVQFDITNGAFSSSPANFLVFNNGELVPSSAIEISANSISIPSNLKEGRNDIDIYVKDNQDLSLLTDTTLWVGSQTLNATILDKNGQSISDVVVKAKLGDDQNVLAEAKSSGNGQVSFPNLPNRTIILDALAGDGRFVSSATTGNAEEVILTLKEFNSSSLIDNNDFSLGVDGWNIGDALVTLRQNGEPVNTTVQSPSMESATTSNSESLNIEALSLNSNQQDITATPAERTTTATSFTRRMMSNVDSNTDPETGIDLVLSTSGEGEQSISRTFTTKPGIESVTLRYQFITSEVPGGYFGSEYNDYYNISLRSLKGSGFETDGNTMNGLGLAAFDASGATEFREVTLPVSKDGDTVQVDISVANVADGLLDSEVVIDQISEEDKTDYEDIDIKFKAFIPSEAVSLVPDIITKNPRGLPVNPLSLSLIFSGDNRSFSYDGSYRSLQDVTVTADPEKLPVVPGSLVRDFGETKGYFAYQGSQVPGQPFWWWQLNPEEKDKHWRQTSLQVTDANNDILVERVAPDTVKTTLKVRAGIPLLPGAPLIDAKMEVFVRQKEGKKPEYKINARHDGFPAYELYIDRKLVYSHDPIAKSPWDLIGDGDQKISSGWQNAPINT